MTDRIYTTLQAGVAAMTYGHTLAQAFVPPQCAVCCECTLLALGGKIACGAFEQIAIIVDYRSVYAISIAIGHDVALGIIYEQTSLFKRPLNMFHLLLYLTGIAFIILSHTLESEINEMLLLLRQMRKVFHNINERRNRLGCIVETHTNWKTV